MWAGARAAAKAAANRALDSAAHVASSAAARAGRVASSAAARAGTSLASQLRDGWARVPARERLRSASTVQAERAASLARATTARISQAAVDTAKTTAGRFVPDVRARWTRFRNRSIGATLACLFVYSAGSATPQALANYQLESQQREERRQAEQRRAPSSPGR
jgi:hypothetical protein